MRKPLDRNSPIDNKRYKKWIDRFGTYRSGVTRTTIESWLAQFKKKDKDLAARILDSVLFFGQDQIVNNFRSSLASFDGWHIHKTKREGRWFFVPMSCSAGKSGDSMLYLFRAANNLDHSSHDEMFIYPSDLVRQKLGPKDNVVLLDDFSGTGEQVCSAWADAFSELVAGAGKVYLIVVVATDAARKRIKDETNILVRPAHTLGEKDNLFSDKCSYFSKEEKDTVLEYTTKADKISPRGYGNCGLLVTFHHKCPNNSLPILYQDNTKWTGVFPRHD